MRMQESGKQIISSDETLQDRSQHRLSWSVARRAFLFGLAFQKCWLASEQRPQRQLTVDRPTNYQQRGGHSPRRPDTCTEVNLTSIAIYDTHYVVSSSIRLYGSCLGLMSFCTRGCALLRVHNVCVARKLLPGRDGFLVQAAPRLRRPSHVEVASVSKGSATHVLDALDSSQKTKASSMISGMFKRW